jgi:hypothetical protein
VRVRSEGQSRTLVFAGILAGHAVLIYVMATSSTEARLDAENEFHSLPIYLIPLIEEPTPIPIAKMSASIVNAQSYLTVTENTSIAIAEPRQVPAAEGTQPPKIDWAREAGTAIQEMSESKSGSLTFRDRPKEESSSDKKPLGVFERKPAHRAAGIIEELGPGLERRWLSERCYIEFGHLPELIPGRGPRVNPVRCMT